MFKPVRNWTGSKCPPARGEGRGRREGGGKEKRGGDRKKRDGGDRGEEGREGVGGGERRDGGWGEAPSLCLHGVENPTLPSSVFRGEELLIYGVKQGVPRLIWAPLAFCLGVPHTYTGELKRSQLTDRLGRAS